MNAFEVTDAAIHKMCEYLGHDPEGSPCMKCPAWELLDKVPKEYNPSGKYQRMCYGLAKESIVKALEAIGYSEAELLAERTRRLKAEEVVDQILLGDLKSPEYLFGRAEKYRTQYPRVGEDK